MRAGIELDPSAPYEATRACAVFDDEMRYVKLRANLLHLESTLSAGGAYVAAFDGSAAGRSLLLRQQQPSTLTDIKGSLQKLERKLGLVTPPSLDSDTMKASFKITRANLTAAGRLLILLSLTFVALPASSSPEENFFANAEVAQVLELFVFALQKFIVQPKNLLLSSAGCSAKIAASRNLGMPESSGARSRAHSHTYTRADCRRGIQQHNPSDAAAKEKMQEAMLGSTG